MLFAVLFFSGCKCQWYADKAIEKGCLSFDSTMRTDTFIKVTIERDTVIKHDTAYIVLDSTFTQPDSTRDKDTLHISDKGITGTLFIDWKTRTAKIALKIPIHKETKTINNNKDSTTTISNEKKVTARIEPRVEKCSHFWCNIKFWVCFTLLAGSIISRFKK
jgi:hypothetical protein